jgi:hypothetical protein
MATLPIPVARILVPPTSDVPAGFETLQLQIRTALPVPIDLGAVGSLLLVVATGHALRWRDADAADVVSSPEHRGEPLVLLYRRNGTIAGTAPVVQGRHSPLPPATPAVDLLVLDWEIRAGNVRGPGDFGSYLRLAWRAIPRGTDRFSPAPLHPQVVTRG